MRKGLTQTLMAVAVVMMAVQAMAMAPTIGDIPSPVVGDLQGVTDSNIFAYPDAFDLTKFGHDRETAQNQLQWTYEVMGDVPGTSIYTINGAEPLSAAEIGANDETTPSQTVPGKIIAGPGAVDTDNLKVDNSPNTITIRNRHLSPFNNPAANAGGEQADGFIDAESRQVVFYVTDLSQATASNPIWFYSKNNSADYLSPNGERAKDINFLTTDAGFTFLPGEGSFASSYDATNGMCMFVELTGGPDPNSLGHNNSCQWDSPFGIIQLVQNSVYRVRCTISGSMTGPAASGPDTSFDQRTPLWDLQVVNFKYTPPATFQGLYAYTSDSFFFDNVGGAEGTWHYVGTDPLTYTTVAGTKTYDYWWTPPAVMTTQWNDTRLAAPDIQGPGPYAVGAGVDTTAKDAMFTWRILDSERNGGINAQFAQGTLCMTGVTIDRFDLNSMHVVNTQANGLYNPSLANVNVDATTDYAVSYVGDQALTTVSTAGGGITLTPAGTGPTSMLAEIDPGNLTPLDYFSDASVRNKYPVSMDNQTIYLVTYQLSAPTQADADNPPDAIWVGADMVSNERLDLSTQTLFGFGHGMPNTTPQPFVALFSSSYGTQAADPNASVLWFRTFRPRFMVGNNPDFAVGAPNTGAIKIHQIRVDQVEFAAPPTP